VEGDRGEDLGIVVSRIPAKDFREFEPTAGFRGRGFCAGQTFKKLILRHATSEERTSLIEKVVEEEIALQAIRQKVYDRNIPMKILDAEYQFDRHKVSLEKNCAYSPLTMFSWMQLVFFFEAHQRIDFRDLVSELFSQFKTRIWMQQVDTSCLPQQEIRTKIAAEAGLLLSSYNREQFEALRIKKEIAALALTSHGSGPGFVDYSCSLNTSAFPSGLRSKTDYRAAFNTSQSLRTYDTEPFGYDKRNPTFNGAKAACDPVSSYQQYRHAGNELDTHWTETTRGVVHDLA
jgi:hypothetical protein